MRIELIGVGAKSAEHAGCTCAFSFALTDILQVILVGGERSVELRGTRGIIVIIRVHFLPR